MGYLYDLNLEDDLETLLLIPDRSPVVITEVIERMRPDPVMGAPCAEERHGRGSAPQMRCRRSVRG